jgi:hypothetical protein
MNSCKPRIIYERSSSISIPQTSPTNKKEDFRINEYSLTQNIFDPSKSSPPNEFMLKLQLRMNLYNSFFINDDSLINE